MSISSAKKLCLAAVILSASLAGGQEIDVDKIILTVPKFDPAGQPLGGPVTFKCDEFELRFSAKAKPVSLKRLSDGKELIHRGKVSEGFYLNSFKGRIPFEMLAKRKDGSYVVMTPNKTQRVIFTVENRGKYLAFRIKGLHGIPTSNNVTLHYEMLCDHNIVRAFGLDYMTEDWGSFPVTWRWLWRRGAGIPRGAFAMYLKNDDADEDDKLLRIWVKEKLPHPAIKGPWDEQAARAWMKKWIETFSDTSVLWYPFPKSEKELYEMIPHLKIAGIKEVHLAPWSWADRTHHCRVNGKFFTGRRVGLRKYALEMAKHGMRVTLHYNFCEIRFDDPVFVGKKPNDGLASWGKGTLLKDADAKTTTLYFRPGPRTQLPYAINPIYRECLPPALVFNNDFHYVRIGDEIIKVGRFQNTESDVWILRDCKRGLGSTLAAPHRAKDLARGLVVMYNFSFLPGTDSKLFDTMTSELASLLNDCLISHIEYDGLNPCVWAMGEFAYRKWTGEAYAKIDHPITYMTGYGEARRRGHFEYRFNAVKKLRGKILGPRGDIGARIRTWHVSRPAGTMDEAQFRMMSAMDYKHAENIVLQPAIADVVNPSEAKVTGDNASITIERRNTLGKALDRKSQDSVMPVWHRKVDMRNHRGVGMWVTGDGSGSLVVLRLPSIRDYVVKLDFKGRKYFEVPNGEAFWAGADWGGPIRSAATACNYNPKWFKLDFGSIPARKTVKVTVEGIKALKDIPARLVNPVIGVGGGRLSVQGTVKTDEILQYEGGKSATLYDKNWNKIADLPVLADKYVMTTGYHKVTVTGDQDSPQPWMFVRFITEGDDPIVIKK